MSKGLEELKRLAYENACCRCQYCIDNKCTNKGECVWKTIENELKEYEQLKIIEQAETRGFYFKDYQNNNEIRFSGNSFIRVGNQFVETKPCYEVKETTLYSCYNPLQYPSPSKKVEDAHFWSWKTHLHFRIDEHGKTWALTREELEK